MPRLRTTLTRTTSTPTHSQTLQCGTGSGSGSGSRRVQTVEDSRLRDLADLGWRIRSPTVVLSRLNDRRVTRAGADPSAGADTANLPGDRVMAGAALLAEQSHRRGSGGMCQRCYEEWRHRSRALATTLTYRMSSSMANGTTREALARDDRVLSPLRRALIPSGCHRSSSLDGVRSRRPFRRTPRCRHG